MLTFSAEISTDGVYRYTLLRIWDASKPMLRFVMLNPSTADGKTDDPTIRKCIGFARRLGYGGILVLNVFAFRARDPKRLIEADEFGDIVGPENDQWFMRDLFQANVIVGWGAWGSRRELAAGFQHAREVIKAAKPVGVFCLGRTSDGQPRHPLMLSYETPLEEFAL